MKVRGNEDFLKYLALREERREKFTKETESINFIFFSLSEDVKKVFLSRFYEFGYGFILLTLIFVMTLGDIIYPKQFGYIIIGLCLVLLVILFIRFYKANKERLKIKKDWNARIKEVEKYKRDAYEYSKKAAMEVPSIICFTENYLDILNHKKNSSENEFEKFWIQQLNHYINSINRTLKNKNTPDDIIDYYLKWGRKITKTEYEDYQLFIAQRLRRFKIDT